MKKIIYVLLLFLLPAQLLAGYAGTLVVNLRDGTSAVFALSDKPCITFSGGSMNIVTATNNTEFLRIDVKNYVFNDIVASINNATKEEVSVSVEPDGVVLAGLVANAPVAVYSIDAQCITNTSADNSGCCRLSFATLPNDIYIINYNNTTIKYLKK